MEPWRWEVFIGARRYRNAERARVFYGKDGSGVLDFAVEADLSGMTRAPVRVMCGYEGGAGETAELTEWFTGDLGKPSYDPGTGVSEVEAYGILGAMGRQYFDKPTTFQGVTLRGFFGKIRALLYDARARIDVRSGGLSIEDTVFPGEDHLREGAEAILEGFDHVMRERPGFGLIVTPRPRPAALGKYTAVFSEPDYPVGQPKIVQSGEGPYAKVIVYRRNESGVEVVRAEAKVTQNGAYKAKPNEIYPVPDFDGDQATAQSVASSTANALVIDGFSGRLEDFSPNMDLLVDSPVLLKRVEREPGSRASLGFAGTRRSYNRHYAAVITTAEIDLKEISMTVSFDALRIKDEEIPSRQVPLPPSPYAIPAEGTVFATPFGTGEYGRLYFRRGSNFPYAGEDAAGLWVDPSLAENGEVGVDEYGRIFVEVSPAPPETGPEKITASDTRTIQELGDYTIGELN